jgi:hypothetical protein
VSGPAELAKAQIRAAIAKIYDTKVQINNAKVQVTDVGVQVNSATSSVTDSLRAELTSVSMLRDAVNIAETALIGSTNVNATQSLVWLQKVDDELVNDVSRLQQLQENLNEISRQIASISTNHEENIKRLGGAVNELTGHISRLG